MFRVLSNLLDPCRPRVYESAQAILMWIGERVREIRRRDPLLRKKSFCSIYRWSRGYSEWVVLHELESLSYWIKWGVSQMLNAFHIWVWFRVCSLRHQQTSRYVPHSYVGSAVSFLIWKYWYLSIALGVRRATDTSINSYPSRQHERKGSLVRGSGVATSTHPVDTTRGESKSPEGDPVFWAVPSQCEVPCIVP